MCLQAGQGRAGPRACSASHKNSFGATGPAQPSPARAGAQGMWDVLTAETLWRGELRSAATKPSLQAIHVAAFMPLLFCLQAKPAANLPGSLLSLGL